MAFWMKKIANVYLTLTVLLLCIVFSLKTKYNLKVGKSHCTYI